MIFNLSNDSTSNKIKIRNDNIMYKYKYNCYSGLNYCTKPPRLIKTI